MASDVTVVTDQELRARVAAWSPHDAFTDDQARAAYRELAIRRDVEIRLAQQFPDRVTAPAPLPTPPWLVPAGPRLRSWERPRGSRNYPVEAAGVPLR